MGLRSTRGQWGSGSGVGSEEERRRGQREVDGGARRQMAEVEVARVLEEGSRVREGREARSRGRHWRGEREKVCFKFSRKITLVYS